MKFFQRALGGLGLKPRRSGSRFSSRPRRPGGFGRRCGVEPLEQRTLLSLGTMLPDCFIPPAAELATDPAASPPPVGSRPYGASAADTSEYMLGDVWVTVVLLESDGTIDTQTENWTTTEIGQVKNEITEGLHWWEDTLATQFPNSEHDLTFHVDFTYADSPVATGYEPINHGYSYQGNWIDSFLNQVGYNSASGYFTDVRNWDDAQRLEHQCHWSYTIFVADSSADSDGSFTDGYFAYAYLGGPFCVLTYDNDGWGIDRMGQVLAHETGHIFYALDEYPGAGSYYDYSGYYNTQNLNAYDSNPSPGSRVASIMGEAALQNAAYPAHTSSPTSLQMLGWQDSDGDHIFDVLDVPLTLNGAGAYNASLGQYEFLGSSAVHTLNNLNPESPTKNDITTNTVDKIQYRLDGGTWTDGNTYGEYTPDVSQNVTVGAGSHTIEFRTIFAETGLTSNVIADSFGEGQTWTFMVYLDGDNDLEAAGINDFLEMASAGSDDNINIVVQFDRNSGFESSYDNWTDTRRGIVMPGDVPNSSWGVSIGEANMGAAATLSEFTNWAIGNYPATNYALVLWDHGGGWRSPEVYKSACWDYGNGGDYLENREVGTALADVPENIDLFGYDCCLMAMLECAHQVRNEATVFVTSEELEPNDGWPYNVVLAHLKANPAWTAAQLGADIVEQYGIYYGAGSSTTQSAVDLSVIGAAAPAGLSAAVGNLADAIMSYATAADYTLLQADRDNASYFGGHSEFRDLGTLLDNIADDAALAPEIRSAAQTALVAYNNAVMENFSGSGEGGTGLSIYFQEAGSSPSAEYNSSIISFAADTQWDEFLNWWAAPVFEPVIYINNLNVDPGWTATGQWAFGQPLGGGGTVYGYPDPTSGATGTNVYGVNLAGDYNHYSPSGPWYVTTEAIDCSGYQDVQLKFKRWLNTDESAFVPATVAVSNNGAAWTNVYANTGAVADNAWQTVQYDISAVANDQATVYIRWGYEVKASAYPYSGWNIDDIKLTGTPIPGQNAEIHGAKWNDLDGQGDWDAGEPGLAGWTIFLDQNQNGILEDSGLVDLASGNVNLVINDYQTTTSTISAGSLSGQILDVNLTLNITHTYDADLTATLISPTGTSIVLFDRVGGGGDNFTGTVLDDEATTAIASGVAPFTGSYQPANPLSVLDGIDPNGTWTLQIRDNANGDTGTLINWSLSITLPSEVWTLTDADGNYAFTNLTPGTYTVAEVQQEGWTQTAPEAPGVYTVPLGVDEIVTGKDFGNHGGEAFDFGDAPDPTYPTLLAGNGARHLIAGPMLGSNRDAETDGQPTVNADGDDSHGTTDDEDGVVFTSLLVGGQSATVQVTASAAGLLNAWLDFNCDGDWADTGEKIFTNQALTAGVNNLNFPVPATPTGATYARFRLSTEADLSYTGLASDGEVEDYAFGVISGNKWNDANGDGVWDAGEPGLSGWEIYLDSNTNGQWDAGEPKTVTGTNGAYSFTGLPVKTYTVAEVHQTGWTQTFPAAPGTHSIALAGNLVHEDVDFGNAQIEEFTILASADGYANDNGLDGTFETLDTTSTDFLTRRFASTGEDRGLIEFNLAGISPGTTVLSATLQVRPSSHTSNAVLDIYGYTGNGAVSLADATATATKIGEAPITTLSTTSVSLDPAFIESLLGTAGYLGLRTQIPVLNGGWASLYSLEATYIPQSDRPTLIIRTSTGPSGEIHGVKWNDLDGNGTQDSGEPGLAGWEIYLDSDASGHWDQGEPKTVTGTNGAYSFTDLAAGLYTVAEVQQTGWAQTYPAAPGTHSITLADDEIRNGVNFGNRQLPGEIHGAKWSDLDSDGVWDQGEPGLSNWEIYIDSNANGQWDDGEPKTTTDSNGAYAFTGLVPGTYVIGEVQQAGWQQTFPATARSSVGTGVSGSGDAIPVFSDPIYSPDGDVGNSVVDTGPGSGSTLPGGIPAGDDRPAGDDPQVGFISVDSPPEGDAPRALTFTPDGNYLLVVNRDTDNVTVYNAATRAVVATVPVGDNPTDVAVNANYALVTNLNSNSVTVINLGTWTVNKTIPITGTQPFRIMVTADGNKAVVGVSNASPTPSSFSVLDLTTLTEVRSFATTHQGSFITWVVSESGDSGNEYTRFAVSPDNQTVVLPDRSGSQVMIYDLTTGSQLTAISTAAAPTSVDISADGTTAVIGHESTANTISVITLAGAGSYLSNSFTTAENLDNHVIRITPDKSHVVATSYNNVMFVNMTTGATVTSFAANTINDLEFSYDNQYLFVSGYQPEIVNIATQSVVKTFSGLFAYEAAVSPTGPRAAVLYTHGTEEVEFFNINGAAGSFEGVVPAGSVPEGDCPRYIAVSPDGKKALVGNTVSGNVSIIDLATQTVLGYVTTGTRVQQVAFTPDGNTALAANMESHTLSIIDLTTNTVVKTLSVPSRPDQIAVSPDGQWAYVNSVLGPDNVHFIRLAGASSYVHSSLEVGNYGTAYGASSGITLSPDGSVLAACSTFTNELILFDTATKSVMAAVPTDAYPLQAVFSPDGTKVYVINNSGNTVSVVNVDGASSSVVATVSGMNEPRSIRIDAAGAFVYVGNCQYDNPNLKVISTASNSVVKTLTLPGGAYSTYLSPTNSVLYALCDVIGGTPSVFRIDAQGAATAIIDETPINSDGKMLAFSESLKTALVSAYLDDGIVTLDFAPSPLGTHLVELDPGEILSGINFGNHSEKTRIWDGGGTNDNWNTPENWSPDGVPAANSILVFPAGLGQTTVNNFDPGTTFESILLNGSGYQLQGNAVRLTGNLTDSATSGANIVALSLEGPGGIVKTGGGTLTLTGANTYTGETLVQGGVLNTNTIGSATGPSDAVTVENDAVLTATSITTHTLTIGNHVDNTRTWDGGGTNDNWSTPENWSPDGVPPENSILVFPAGFGQTTVNNFDPGTTFKSIVLAGSGYQLQGNAVRLTDNLTDSATSGANVVALSLEGPGGIVKTGGGTLNLTGAYTYTGATLVTGGVLNTQTIGSSSGPTSSVTVENDAVLTAASITTHTLTIGDEGKSGAAAETPAAVVADPVTTETFTVSADPLPIDSRKEPVLVATPDRENHSPVIPGPVREHLFSRMEEDLSRAIPPWSSPEPEKSEPASVALPETAAVKCLAVEWGENDIVSGSQLNLGEIAAAQRATLGNELVAQVRKETASWLLHEDGDRPEIIAAVTRAARQMIFQSSLEISEPLFRPTWWAIEQPERKKPGRPVLAAVQPELDLAVVQE